MDEEDRELARKTTYWDFLMDPCARRGEKQGSRQRTRVDRLESFH